MGRAFTQRTPLTAHIRSSHTQEELQAVGRERIGRTAIRTADGIFDVKDGRSVQPLAVPGAGGENGPQPVVSPAVPPRASTTVTAETTSVSGGNISRPTNVGVTLAPLMSFPRYVADGGSGGDGGGGGSVSQALPSLQDAMEAL